MTKILDIINAIVNFYFAKRISRSSAALAYYITLTIFPLLICLNAILANTGITIIQILEEMKGFIPNDIISVLESYILYISENNSPGLLWSGIILTLTTSSAAFRVLMNSIYDCVGEVRYDTWVGFILSFLLSILFMAVLYLGVVIMLTGQWIFQRFNTIPQLLRFADSWKWIRFVVLFLLLYILITATYKMTIKKKKRKSYVINNTAFMVAAVLVLLSAAFSLAIEAITRYTLVYGSLVSIIILMLWLYFCGNVLIIGSFFCHYYIEKEFRKDQARLKGPEMSE